MSPSIIFEDFVSAYFVYHTQAICFNFRIGQITNALYEVDGHTVDEIDFDLLEYIVPTYYVLTTAEASSNLNRYDGVRYGYRSKNAEIKDLTNFYKYTRTEGFGKEVQKRILLGTFVLSTGYFDALQKHNKYVIYYVLKPTLYLLIMRLLYYPQALQPHFR